MIKRNKITLIFSSIVILLPTLFGVAIWDKLPEKMAMHWGISGEADGYTGTLLGIVLLPVFFLAVQWILVCLSCLLEKKHGEQSKKAERLVLWIIPALSVYMNGIIYATALGYKLNITMLVGLMFGVMMTVIGNYLPKFTRSKTAGIKIRWTLCNDENWNATHRFGGRVWVICGLLLIAVSFLPVKLFVGIAIAIFVAMILIPVIYSYRYAQKQIRESRATKEDFRAKVMSKKEKVIAFFTLSAVAILVAVLMFTGNIKIQYNQDSFTVEATYHENITVNYADIESIEYREDGVEGSRTMGFGSARLMLGTFNNSEFGNYTRYTYTSCNSCVVLRVNGKILVISRIDEAQTKGLYEELCERITVKGEGNG